MCGACSNTTYQRTCTFGDEMDHSPAFCQFELPSGNIANLTNPAYLDSLDSFNNPSYSFRIMRGPTEDYTSHVTQFDIIGSTANFAAWPNSSIIASECALWMCVQAFETSMINTHQIETVGQEFSQVAAAINPNDSNLYFLDIPSTMNPRPGAGFLFHIPNLSALQGYLYHMFNGTMTYLLRNGTSSTSDVVDAVWNSTGDLDKWIKTVAASLTDSIRSSKPYPTQNATLIAAQDAFYNGTGYQLGYDVRWPWVVLPTVLVVSSVVILVATIIKTANSPVGGWKGSPLALLFMEVDPQLEKDAVGQLDVYNGISRSVGKTKVVLESDQKGEWCLKKA